MPSPTTTDSSLPVSGRSASGSCVIHATLRGALGFAVVSLAGFSVWAFSGRWFYAHFGEAGLYAICAVVFLGSSGVLLHPLVQSPNSFLRFYRIFIPAFLAYAIFWCAAWFLFHFGAGEWLGSLLGSLAFVAVTGYGFGNHRGFVRAAVVVFVCHSLGYFLGGKLMNWTTGPTGVALLTGVTKAQLGIIAKLSWGLLYGLGFGAGIGYAFHIAQRGRGERPSTNANTPST